MTNWKKVDADQLDSKLSLIADAIREKIGNTKSMTIDEMPTYINGIKVDDGSFVGLITGTMKHVDIPQGVTEIRPYAFYKFEKLSTVSIPDSITTVGMGAFRDCAILQAVVLGNNVTNIGSSVFTGCKCLLSFIIPDSVTSVGSSGFGDGVFAQCTSLRTKKKKKNVDKLSGPMFYGCSALRTVVFRGTPSITSLSGAYPFYQLSGITDIYVPWSEGAVSGAPWGATNATIHYNSKVED